MHGILNAVSWGILLPIGGVITRYLKAFKSSDPAWFYLHVSCQLIGYALGVTGWGISLNLGSKSKGVQYTTLRNLGIALFSLATLQLVSTALFLRPKKDHKYRAYWNLYHQVVRMVIILLGIINVFRGLEMWAVDGCLYCCALYLGWHYIGVGSNHLYHSSEEKV